MCSFGCIDVVFVMIKRCIVWNVVLIEEGIVWLIKVNYKIISWVFIEVYSLKIDVLIFKMIMLKIIIDVIEGEKVEMVREILLNELIKLNNEDVILLVLEVCFLS